MPLENVSAYAAEMHRFFDRTQNIGGGKARHGHPLRFGDYGRKVGFDTIRTEAGWHVLGEFPKWLIGNQYPTEDDYWFDWRIKNYQPITRGPAQDTLKNVTRLFSETSTVALGVNPNTEEYVSEERFQGKDFFTWMTRSAWPNTPLDPNAFVLCFPHGEGLGNDTIPVDVALQIVESNQIYDFMPNDLVSYKSTRSTTGHAEYWIIDDEWFYHVAENPNNTKRGQLVITEYYNHGRTRPTKPPVQVLGGIEQQIEHSVIYRSFFEPYFPFANEAAKAYSTYQVVAAMHGFPTAEMENRPCDYQDPKTGGVCDNGYVETSEGRVSCGSCGGTGYKAIHPSSTLLRAERPPDVPADATPIKRYIEMPNSMEAMSKNWQLDLELAKESLSKRYVLQDQSGVAKEADREGEYNLYMMLGEWFYGTVIENTLNNLNDLRRPQDGQDAKIIVVPPRDFKIRSAGDLLEELKSAREASTTSGIYVETAREYAGKKYSRNPLKRKKLELQLLLDPLATLTEDERQAKRFSGGADDRAMFINANAYGIIEEIIEESPSNTEKPTSWWRDRFEKEVDDRFIKPVAPSFVPPDDE